MEVSAFTLVIMEKMTNLLSKIARIESNKVNSVLCTNTSGTTTRGVMANRNEPDIANTVKSHVDYNKLECG